MSKAWIERSRLWLVLDRNAAAPRTLPEVTGLAIAGGVDAVLCRIKDAPAEEIRELALQVREVCRERGIPFIMSHNPQLAVDLDADGLQIGVSDPPVTQMREIIGSKMALGYSTHGVGEARQRFADGVDYVFLGPIFATPEKLKYGSPLGLKVINDARKLPGPVIFIGGINLGNCTQVIRAGGRRIAAISALQRVEDPTAQARALLVKISETARET